MAKGGVSILDGVTAATSPSGGKVGAMAGAIGASLMARVCALAVESGEDVDAAIVNAVKMRSTKLSESLLELAEKSDAASKKATKKAKGKELEKTQIEGIEAGIEVAKACYELLKLTNILAQKTGEKWITDVGAAALLADAGVQSSSMNVKVYLKGMKDGKTKKELSAKLNDVEFSAVDEVGETMAAVLPHIEEPEDLEGIDEE